MLNMDISLALTEVFAMWKVALPAMFVGCYCGVVLKSGRFFRFISKVLRPMTSIGKLPESLGTFFILCLLNRYAANAMLAEYEKNGGITKNTLMAVYLMGSLPTGMYFTVFYFSPLLIAGLGWQLGTAYMAINLGLSTSVTIIGLIWNRFLCKQEMQPTVQVDCCAKSEQLGWVQAGSKAFGQFWDIAAVFMPVTLVFALLLHADFMQEVIAGFDSVLHWFNLTAAGVMVVIAGIPTLMAAIGVAGTLLQNGTLAYQDVMVVLLLASFFHNIYDGVSRVLPANLAIFGVKTGMNVTIVGTGLYLIMVAAGIGIALYIRIN